VSNAETRALLQQQSAFALCPMGEFVFAFDSHGLRAILLSTPKGAACLDLAGAFLLPPPSGARRTLHLHQEPVGDFYVTVGKNVRVTDVALTHITRLPPFLDAQEALRHAFALIHHDKQFVYLVDTTSLAERYVQEFR
jgi:hypothetical protein